MGEEFRVKRVGVSELVKGVLHCCKLTTISGTDLHKRLSNEGGEVEPVAKILENIVSCITDKNTTSYINNSRPPQRHHTHNHCMM